LVFHADGRQFYGRKWLQTSMKTKCLLCKDLCRNIWAPSWINECDGDNLFHVWYHWPLSNSQQVDIGITHEMSLLYYGIRYFTPNLLYVSLSIHIISCSLSIPVIYDVNQF
jgi:hypothetical protein